MPPPPSNSNSNSFVVPGSLVAGSFLPWALSRGAAKSNAAAKNTDTAGKTNNDGVLKQSINRSYQTHGGHIGPPWPWVFLPPMSSITCVSAELQHKCSDLTCIGHNPRVTQPSTAHRMVIGKVLNCVVLFYLALSPGSPGVPYCNDPAVVASFSLAVRRSPRQTSAIGLRPTIMAIRSLLLNSHRKNEMAVLSYLKLVLKQ